MPPELVTVAEALEKLDVKRDTFYNTVKRANSKRKRPIRRWRKAGEREVLYDMRQLRPLFERPQEITD